MAKSSIMSLAGHIVELRKQLVIVITIFVACAIVGVIVSPYIFDYIKGRPPASAMEWNVFSPFDGIRMYMGIALAFAFALSLPATMLLLWGFVKKGLHPHEKSAALRYIPYSVICMAAGISFGFYILLPISFSFVSSISEKLHLVETYGVTQYFGFMMNIVLPFAAAFQLPIVVTFLTRVGLLTPKRLQRSRRYAYLILVIVANVLSPPDFVSAFIVLIPLVALFEISVWLSAVSHRKRLKLLESADSASFSAAS